MKTAFYFFLVLLTSNVLSQETHVIHSELFNNPEAMIYDEVSKRYIVGNAGDGKILVIDSLENVSVLNDSVGSNMLMSFEIMGDLLFVSANAPQAIYCLDKNDGELVYKIGLDSVSSGFAQMAVDSRSNYIYVAHQSGKVFKINPITQSCSLFANSGISNTSQSVEVDEENNRLIVLFWSYTTMKYIDIDDSTNVTTSATTGSSSYTGSLKTDDGYIYASSWSGSKIRKIDLAFPDDSENFCTDSLNKPVGISYNNHKDEFAVSNFGNHTVTIIRHANESGFKSPKKENSGLSVRMNNYTNELIVNSTKYINQEILYSIFDMTGRLIIQDNMFVNSGEGKVGVQELNSGFYCVVFSTHGLLLDSSIFVK